jgi:hypothetical protein
MVRWGPPIPPVDYSSAIGVPGAGNPADVNWFSPGFDAVAGLNPPDARGGANAMPWYPPDPTGADHDLLTGDYTLGHDEGWRAPFTSPYTGSDPALNLPNIDTAHFSHSERISRKPPAKGRYRRPPSDDLYDVSESFYSPPSSPDGSFHHALAHPYGDPRNAWSADTVVRIDPAPPRGIAGGVGGANAPWGDEEFFDRSRRARVPGRGEPTDSRESGESLGNPPRWGTDGDVGSLDAWEGISEPDMPEGVMPGAIRKPRESPWGGGAAKRGVGVEVVRREVDVGGSSTLRTVVRRAARPTLDARVERK